VSYFEYEHQQGYLDHCDHYRHSHHYRACGDERSSEYSLAGLANGLDRILQRAVDLAAVGEIMQGMSLAKEGKDVKHTRESGVQYADCNRLGDVKKSEERGVGGTHCDRTAHRRAARPSVRSPDYREHYVRMHHQTFSVGPVIPLNTYVM
jgi:hypothetical protein